MFLLAKTEAFRNKLFFLVVFLLLFFTGSFMLWNVLSIELIQKPTPEKFVLMDQGQKLKSLVLIGFCNERAGVARKELQSMVKLCPASHCPVSCVPGVLERSFMGWRGRHRCQDNWYWDLASCQPGPMLCYDQMLWNCFFLPEILGSPPSCCLLT